LVSEKLDSAVTDGAGGDHHVVMIRERFGRYRASPSTSLGRPFLKPGTRPLRPSS
jgi:hypothetical protein